MKKKKMNTYVKYSLLVLLGAFVGGILGAGMTWMEVDRLGDMGFRNLLEVVQSVSLPLIILVLVLSVLLGEWNLLRLKSLSKELSGAEDEEADRLEDRMEVTGSVGLITNNVAMVVAIVLLTCMVSIRYVEANARMTLAVCLGFCAVYAYNGFWQLRYVKVLQRAFPDKMGDPASMRFQKDWLNSCDEAEQEVIYRSAYRTYIVNGPLYSVLAVVGLVAHTMWNTGILAVVMVGIMWCTSTIVYCRATVVNRRRLREK